jgi:hypothetical protein
MLVILISDTIYAPYFKQEFSLLSGELLEISTITLSRKERHFTVPQLAWQFRSTSAVLACRGLRCDVIYRRMLDLRAEI